MAITVIIKNNSGGSVSISNLPIRPIADGTQVDVSNLTLSTIYDAANEKFAADSDSFYSKINSNTIVINDGTKDLTKEEAFSFLEEYNSSNPVPADEITGTFEEAKINGLPNELNGKADSPLTTVAGTFPTYVNTQGDLSDGKTFVGIGNTVVTLNSHNVISDQYLPERLRRYPELPVSGYSSNVNLTSGNIANYLNHENIMDGSDLVITITDPTIIPTKSDFSTDDDTIMFTNHHPTPLQITISNLGPTNKFRTNRGAISSFLNVYQGHFVQLSRTSGFASQIYIMNQGAESNIAPGSTVTITNFSVAKDVPVGTTISGNYTLTFEATGVNNIEPNDYSILLTGETGGSSFALVTIPYTTPLIKEGNNTITVNVETARTLSQDGDFFQLQLVYDSISPNVTLTSSNVWRIDARSTSHPTQGTFKTGWP